MSTITSMQPTTLTIVWVNILIKPQNNHGTIIHYLYWLLTIAIIPTVIGILSRKSIIRFRIVLWECDQR